MIKITKSELEQIFKDPSQTWEMLSVKWTAESDLKITPAMVQAMFKSNGFNPKNRARKSKNSWFTVIDDVSSEVVADVPTSEPTYDSFNIHTEQFA